MTTTTTTLILFQAKSRSGKFLVDSFKTGWKRYHLSQKFNADSLDVRALCGSVYYINWGTPFLIILKDEIEKIKILRKDPNVFCEKCVKVAMVLHDIKAGEVEGGRSKTSGL